MKKIFLWREICRQKIYLQRWYSFFLLRSR